VLARAPCRPGRALGRGLAIALAATALLAPTAGADNDSVTAQRAVQLLNAERARNGLPPDVRERAEWSDACRKHDRYRELGSGDGHDEDPSKPGYTAEGAWAGQNSVLWYLAPSWELGNPWEPGPIHHAQLLAPELQQTGVHAGQTWQCATTWPGYTRPPVAPQLWTYPGPGAETGFAFNAFESPFTPGQFVGFPQGTVTGPYLYVFGPWWAPYADTPSRVVGASLRGPEGAVELRSVDKTHSEVGPYMPASSAFLIPATELRPGSTYAAAVRLRLGGGQELARSWTFRTSAEGSESGAGSGASPRRVARLRVLSLHRRGRRVTARVSLRRGARGRLVVRVRKRARRITARRARRVRRQRTSSTFTYTARLPRGRRARGRWRLIASFDGRSGWGDGARSRRFRVGGRSGRR